MKKREFRRLLTKKGFVEVLNRDHRYYYLKDPDEPGKVITHVRTKLSHSGKEKDIPNSLMSKIYKQLRFRSKRELEKYLDCTMTYEEYIQYLRSIGVI